MPASILIVDDQESLRHFVERALTDEGYSVRTAGDGAKAVQEFQSEIPDLALLDLRLPDTTGIDLLARFKAEVPELPVIMMTAFGEIETAVEAMKLGAFDFLTKPVNLEQVKLIVEKALESVRMWRELEHHRRQGRDQFSRDFVRGSSPKIQQVYDTIDKVAGSDSTTVLITGESGTGKQIIANLIHAQSPRGKKPFLEVNCAAIPRELLESELFGHERGAFTDARTQKQGLLELADGGTLFLDEVGELPLNLQVKLLTVLESMTFRRVGGTRDIKVDVRIVSATNQDLEQMVANGGFREDLYYRLMVVPIRMPSLRERREDVVLLASHFIHDFSKTFHKRFQRLSEEAKRKLLEYPWPGNIRELRNVCERTVLLEDGDIVEADQLRLGNPDAAARSGGLLQSLQRIMVEGIVDPEGVPFEKLIADIERGLIIRAAETAGWNQSRTAEILGIKRDKLRYRMKIHDLHESATIEA
ncbi:MAG: sigma-54-dependent Fis family transcriptional regulator [Candidatus Eisenbacteria bacterium]|uniref:Sigma-54-dependent Fis family transcriptional regulator n=1 Tax=Eiseniibacteriota bacterium TaxID=2212470 RepID=A0A956NFA6_UNCEI|nr:sigma-54-dependent Fis family transcriptional regulator [Candidatus Eisenbacteria bacterium]MCB9462777.1 sigma-54-dependent Fis family transcriptional regulator [Candidatus Eisenbacteria bacterium]